MKRLSVFAYSVALAVTAAAHATVSMDLAGLAGTGVTGHVDFSYSAISDTSATITVSLENTTSAAIGGFITGWAFNVPTIGGISFTSFGADALDGGVTELGVPNESGWWTKYAFEDSKTPNDAGDFDVGVKNNDNINSFISGGSGSGSNVGIGETTTFTLAVVGTGLDDLSNGAFETEFFGEFSSGDPSGDYAFGARYQGLENGGSDLATGTGTPVIPVPASAIMCLLGLAGAGLFRGRRTTSGT